MIHSDGRFKGARDTCIAYQVWLPKGEVKAAILLVHGLGEHSGRYKNLINHLIPLGYAVYAVDHMGHGKSDGVRKHIKTFSDFSDTLDIFLERVKEWHGSGQLFMLGHSMGGLIAAHYLLQNQHHFSGAILSAPALKISDTVPRSTILLGKFLAAVLPKYGIIPINPDKVSRDPVVVQAYLDDPLIHKGHTSARLASELVKAMLRVQNGAATINLPVLILQGSEDAIVNPDGAQGFFDVVGSADKTIKLYDGLYHEVFNEPEKDQVFADVEQWLAAHLEVHGKLVSMASG